MSVASDIASALTKLTGEEWREVPTEYAHYLSVVRDSDSLTLGLRKDYHKKHTISLSLPHGAMRDHLRYNETTPSIGASWPTRSPESIAKDIVNRLLSAAEILHLEVAKRIAAAEVWKNKTEETKAKLETMPGLHFRSDSDTASWNLLHKSSWARDVRVSGDSVSMELHSLTADQALVVLKIVAS